MLNIPQLIAQELSINLAQVNNALELFSEGATIPFIARYRKEKTDSLNEIQLRDISDRFTYLTEIEDRKKSILATISTQGKLTEELEAKIQSCLQKNELEDLYLPYKQKRRTRATIAREKGLEALAEFIQSLNQPEAQPADVEAEAAKYISEEKGVKTAEDALKGAGDILAEGVSEKAELRAYLREFLMETALFVSKIKEDFPEGSTKFEMYRNYQVAARSVNSHNMLALFRGESEGILDLDLTFDEAAVMAYLEFQEIKTKIPFVKEFYRSMLKDAFNRLMKTSLMTEVRSHNKTAADIESIATFETNFRELLLSAPAGMKPTLAIDPGFRTGCKVSALDETGQFLEYQAIFPHQAASQRHQAAKIVKHLIEKYKIELIAIGNGTASRETDEFVAEVLAELDTKPIKVMVNESGASVYSASEVAIAEFPDLDITVRGAVSIGRRLQDPLAELVKIDPKSIGVGQYQHDVDQKLLKKKLDETVESCVNYVGVDLNTASKELLTFVSGMSPTVAKNIVNYRNENGAFKNRRQLLKVPKLGPKAFEQAAGFLRIRNGENLLDNTAVHPESYAVVQAIAKDLNIPLTQVTQIAEKLKGVNIKKYVTEKVGEPTLRDIISELEKPGRDPRAEFKYATFKEGIKGMSDLTAGMELEGIITNVANFGAFVDVGVHQDGLVHISQLADRFVEDPKQIVKVGQVVKVRVLEVNEKLKRISLTMRSPEEAKSDRKISLPQRAATVNDLKVKFNKR
ncbi:MAG: RNA-binding transcriptional accessory protein [Oscillatoriales cyanobacterium]|uniref:Tex family protein n=1 Tax=Microcoleus anatoxicus PTRS2 TaxID=2705321 RepID=A0ABU8YG10_9CYAN|nr:MAG: RNA-binding transcriptional accessory protein [Oscillatoriales cyanobacterium]TAD92684.1 MAG: RNA-binding transcriptional accessory protein [Oscillatoriales cyanobacterium]TAE99869.1 MAG: RNA-binding transcriptional accessory protein [Oscillatoriales cyanobacterium]TAF32080.1 MAG: RNA-binding transcriptional accessory protein [Oscillatoriales cyanobacterium]TAF70148.1 MAG: RNA-binding transcriptional accessory protein [Oscillatoriales cyanobacterium]